VTVPDRSLNFVNRIFDAATAQWKMETQWMKGLMPFSFSSLKTDVGSDGQIEFGIAISCCAKNSTPLFKTNFLNGEAGQNMTLRSSKTSTVI
jgi:hypothetical protein